MKCKLSDLIPLKNDNIHEQQLNNMRKLNGFENYVLKQALKLYAEKCEEEVALAQKTKRKNTTLLYGEGYFTQVAEAISNKVDELTLSKHLKMQQENV